MIGVTGTNGKTTVCYLTEGILAEAGLRPCLFGTVVYRYGRDEVKADRTTPESLDLYRHLDRFATAGARSCVMEVSSHALAQSRTAGITFKAGVFTNLTQDHLDFHGSMERYRESKALLFRGMSPDAVAVLNADDPATPVLAAATAARVVTFGRATGADVRIAAARVAPTGTEITLQIGPRVEPAGDRQDPAAPLELRTPLLGAPNAQNVAAAAALALALGLPRAAVVGAVAAARGAPGRFERVDDGGPFMVMVDFAHTDDALTNLLETVRALRPRRVITVFGCGGDRDRAKRPKMGFAAARGSDVVVVTSDNPRSEDPMAIIEEILPGVRRALTGDADGRITEERCVVAPDRRVAIRRALEMAAEGDCVVIAGKGHETYQTLADRTVPFDDRQVARDLLAALHRGRNGQAAE
jgi:UDP-N-acetylmuramoyl-L-alanyl-D-glutamate--2,6-diaminopimelate ligase